MATAAMPRVTVTTAGECMAVLAPSAAERLRHAETLRLRVGGAESNVAIALARLDLPARWVSRVGDDELGRRVLAAVAGEGVDVAGVEVAAGERTGLYLRDHAGGVVRAHYYRGGSAASRLAPDVVPPAVLAASEVVHLTGITPALSRQAAAFVSWAVDVALDAGAVVSFDVNYRQRLWAPDEARDALTDLARRATVVLVGHDEGRALWGESDASRLGERLAGSSDAEVVVKHGPAGATRWCDGAVEHAEGFVVDEVDPVGAGDAFAAGYLAARAWGRSPAERLRVANALGALGVASPGDYEGLPDRAELDAFLDGAGDLGR